MSNFSLSYPARASFLARSARVLLTAGLLLSLGVDAALAQTTQPKKRKTAVSKQASDDTEFVNFKQWKQVGAFIDDMAARNGFDREALQATFGKTRYIDTAIRLVRPAPSGKPKNWQAYRARFVEPVRIDGGVAFWNQYEGELARAESQYGVPAEIIVAILGVETVYGRNTGNFRVMDVLTTLAFDYPDTPNRAARMDFFKGELENTLLFARDSGIDPFSLLGSYAGAIGWPQFMPGSIRQYAVDFDGDGRIDLRNSPVDAIGSVAHYLAEHGWQRGAPIVFPASVGLDGSGAYGWEAMVGQGLEAKYSPEALRGAGVTPGTPLPSDMQFGLIDLQNGLEPTEYWLATANFFAITQYNRSYFYAMSVVDLGRAVRSARGR